MTDKATRALVLYIRAGCHLCVEMHQALRPWCERLDFDLSLRDIDEDPRLCEQYHYKVPVLVEGEEEICHFFLDEEMLMRHFESTS